MVLVIVDGMLADIKGGNMIVNKPYTNKEYADLAVYCNQNDCHIEDNGDYLESVPNEHPAPTEEEQREKRSIAYQQEVDPITCHIQRLEDEEQTPEIEKEIADLKQERSAKVEEIKERYPYTVEEE